MRIAIIGGTRFIGHAAAQALVARGHDALVLHRGRHPCEVSGVTEVLVDRGDVEALRRCLVTARPDAILDTRAMTAGDAAATLAALEGLDAAAVVLSSQDVYAQFGRLNGLPAPEPEPRITESSPLTVPHPFRGLAEHDGGEDYDKKDVERLFLESGRAVTILRLPAVYGRRDPQRRFGRIVDALDRGERRLPGHGAFRWTHAQVDDVAHAVALALEQPASTGRVFNVGEEPTPSMRERAERIAARMGCAVEFDGGGVPDEWGVFGSMPNDVVVDTSAIRAALGYAEVRSEAARLDDLIEGLRVSRAG